MAEELRGEYEVCDVGDGAAVDRVAHRVRKRPPQLRLLVSDGGMPGRATFLDGEAERIEEVMRVNYFGGIWCLRAFLPALEAAGSADVVDIVSVAGHVAYPPAGPYGASKHAQLAFSRAARAELRRRRVRVHTVCPGFVETEGFPQRGRVRSALFQRIVIEPDDVARHVLSVLADDRRETFVPAYYRVAALAQALAPGLVSRYLER